MTKKQIRNQLDGLMEILEKYGDESKDEDLTDGYFSKAREGLMLAIGYLRLTIRNVEVNNE